MPIRGGSGFQPAPWWPIPPTATARHLRQVAVILNASEAVFGSAGQAQCVVQNFGNAFTVGLGPGYSLSRAILAPLTANNGNVETAGYLRCLEMTSNTPITAIPQPAVLGVARAGGALLYGLRRRLRP
jgi:hypothetical protein